MANRTIRLFLALEAASFASASLIHSGRLVAGYEHRAARIAEAVIAAVLLVGLIAAVALPVHARRVGLTVRLVRHDGRHLHDRRRSRAAHRTGYRVPRRHCRAAGVGPVRNGAFSRDDVMSTLKDKVALVTGSSRGIGAALFLVSENAAWITGLIVDVSGGAVMI
jgi:hypothetical protein